MYRDYLGYIRIMIGILILRPLKGGGLLIMGLHKSKTTPLHA